MAVTIRPGGPDDFDAALAVYNVSSTARRGGKQVEDWRLAEVRAEIAHPEGWLLMAEDEGVAVGMATAMPSRREHGQGELVPGLCYLGLVFVVPERWGERIGSRLTDLMLDEAKARGFTRIHLWTHENNARAHALYEPRGFVRTGANEPGGNDPEILSEEWERSL